jgi:hypothetical protein
MRRHQDYSAARSSKESIDYIRAMVADAGSCISGVSGPQTYRAERPGIPRCSKRQGDTCTHCQGNMPSTESVPTIAPDWDKRVVVMVPSWRKLPMAGATGPISFISGYEKLRLFWGHNTLLVSLSFIQSFVRCLSLSISCCLCLTHIVCLCVSCAGEIQDEESMKVVNHIIMELPSKTIWL